MNTKDNILKRIFFDENKNWESFIKLHPKNIREIVYEEVEKFRLCGEEESGFSLFACEVCGEIKIVPHRCKGKFCSVCATGYMQEWSKNTAENLYNMPHRHIMFTMPEELWEIFLKRRDLLKNLMDLAIMHNEINHMANATRSKKVKALQLMQKSYLNDEIFKFL